MKIARLQKKQIQIKNQKISYIHGTLSESLPTFTRRHISTYEVACNKPQKKKYREINLDSSEIFDQKQYQRPIFFKRSAQKQKFDSGEIRVTR